MLAAFANLDVRMIFATVTYILLTGWRLFVTKARNPIRPLLLKTAFCTN